MRSLLRGWSLSVGVLVFALVASGRIAIAAPAPGDAEYATAVKLYRSGDNVGALAAIEQGLPKADKKAKLFCLKGRILQDTVNFTGTLEAYVACRDAGAVGPDARTAKAIIEQYQPVKTTFLDISIANGAASIYLDSKNGGDLCPPPVSSCNRGVLAKSYRVIVERPGFDRWTSNVTAARDKTTKVEVTLVEKPSPLTVRVAQANAAITVDGAPYDPKAKLPAGKHRVVITLDNHADEQRDIVAREGNPIAVDVSLTPLLPINVTPAEAVVKLDGKPVVITNGRIAVPSGEHTVTGEAKGYRPGKAVVPADRPADHPITLALVVVPPPPPPLPVWTTRRKIAAGVAGLGVVAAGAGIVLGLQSKSLEDDAFKKCASPTTPCADAREANDLNKRGRDRALQANIAYGVAAGAAVTAAVLWFTGGAEQPESRVAITPQLPLQRGAAAGVDIALRF